MATKSNRKGTEWQPPRGVRFFERNDRPQPFFLQWRVEGQRKTLSFPDAAARELYARELVEQRGTHGTALFTFDPNEWRTWQTFKERAEGVDPLQILAEWKAGRSKATGSLTVQVAVEKFVTIKKAEKAWSEGRERQVDLHLERFYGHFGARPVRTLTTDEIRVWLQNLGVGQHATLHHLKTVSAFLKRAVVEGWGIEDNPCDRIKLGRIIEGDPEVIEIEMAQRFFEANRGQPFLPRLALEAFGGIRSSHAGRIVRECIDFDRRGIRLSARVHKVGMVDGKTRYRQGHPDNLWLWLERATDATWAMTPRDYTRAKREGWIRAGVTPTLEDHWTRNIWRHSFISYHRAAFENPPLTQRLAQHATAGQTEEYEGMATKQDAVAYFGIGG